MKKMLLLVPAGLAVLTLSGCVAYADPHGAYGYSGSGYGYGYSQPGYVYGSGYQGGRGYGDRDRDGVRNRYDRDRDGDGVRNRDDARPDNPRRY
jgi:hypothetical protein